MNVNITKMLSFLALSLICILFTGNCKAESPLAIMMSRENVTYKIEKAYDLEGQKIEVPKNCLIEFGKSGKIYNGILVGNETRLRCRKKSLGVKLKGKWKTTQIRDEWFDTFHLTDGEILDNINILMRDDICQNVYIAKEIYDCPVEKNPRVVRLASNTNLNLKSTLRLLPSDRKNYSIISIRDKKNVKVKGGTIIGDVNTHIVKDDKSPGEWGMGINIYHSENIIIEGVKVSKCWGDGIYVSGESGKEMGKYEHASKNVTIKNVECDDNRRQGMSVTHVDGLFVKGCKFINTGRTKYTGPGAGVDLEPNVEEGRFESCRNIYFENCLFSGNNGPAFFQYNSVQNGSELNMGKIRFTKCRFDGNVYVCSNDVAFYQCKLENLMPYVNSSHVSVMFYNCEINSKDSQMRSKKPKCGFDGDIKIEMHRCEIILNDAMKWMNEGRLRQIDNLTCENCNLYVPSNVENMVDTSEISKVKGVKLHYLKQRN